MGAVRAEAKRSGWGFVSAAWYAGGILGGSPPSLAQVWVGGSPALPTVLHWLGPSRVWVPRVGGC